MNYLQNRYNNTFSPFC